MLKLKFIDNMLTLHDTIDYFVHRDVQYEILTGFD